MNKQQQQQATSENLPLIKQFPYVSFVGNRINYIRVHADALENWKGNVDHHWVRNFLHHWIFLSYQSNKPPPIPTQSTNTITLFFTKIKSYLHLFLRLDSLFIVFKRNNKIMLKILLTANYFWFLYIQYLYNFFFNISFILSSSAENLGFCTWDFIKYFHRNFDEI